MKIQLFVRNDIYMPLGKIAAQCAHALNAALLSRLTALQTQETTILTPTPELIRVLTSFSNLVVELNYGDLDYTLSSAESDEAFIQDRGRTVFSEPTITVTWKTEGWGETVVNRLPFQSEDIPFKQPIFVNRSNPLLDENTVITAAAKVSTTVITGLFNPTTHQIKLRNTDPMIQWVQHGFGKTVVGCKKASHFNACISILEEEQGYNYTRMRNSKGTVVLAHYPIASDEIEKFTRNKFAR